MNQSNEEFSHESTQSTGRRFGVCARRWAGRRCSGRSRAVFPAPRPPPPRRVATVGDGTHYRTIRRTEYAAQVAEQVLAAELGRLYRNPLGEDRTVTLELHRRPEQVECRLYDAAGKQVESTQETAPERITRVVPADGCLRLRYGCV